MSGSTATATSICPASSIRRRFWLRAVGNGRFTGSHLDVDRDNVERWFSENAEEILERFGGRWLTADFKPGDILTFGLYTLHASTTNTTKRFRLSCDVRFQPSSEPTDERWVGASPKGHYAWMKTPGITMEAARERWGV